MALYDAGAPDAIAGSIGLYVAYFNRDTDPPTVIRLARYPQSGTNCEGFASGGLPHYGIYRPDGRMRVCGIGVLGVLAQADRVSLIPVWGQGAFPLFERLHKWPATGRHRGITGRIPYNGRNRIYREGSKAMPRWGKWEYKWRYAYNGRDAVLNGPCVPSWGSLLQKDLVKKFPTYSWLNISL